MSQISPPLIAALATLVVSLGCRAPLASDEYTIIEGAWNFSETVATRDGANSCRAFGTMSLVQDAENFVGSYTRSATCTAGSPEGLGNKESGGIEQGEAREDVVRFRIDNCEYQGIVTDEDGRPTRLTGTVLCTTFRVSPAGGSVQPGNATTGGTWEAQLIDDPQNDPI